MMKRWTRRMRFWKTLHNAVNRRAHRIAPLQNGKRPHHWIWTLNDWLAKGWIDDWINRRWNNQ